MYFKERLELYKLPIYVYKHILFLTWYTYDNRAIGSKTKVVLVLQQFLLLVELPLFSEAEIRRGNSL